MAQVISKLPNQPGTVNGFLFTKKDDFHLSQEMSDSDAAYFASIKGYEIFVEEPAKTEGDTKPPAPKKGAT